VNSHGRGQGGKFTRTAQTAENDARAVRLRAQGASYSSIAKALGYHDESGAYKAVQRALAAIPAPEVEELRALQGEELDALRRGLWQVIYGTHYKVSNSGRVVMDPATGEPLLDPAPKISAGNALARVLDRQAKLFGLDQPTRVEASITLETAWQTIDAELARLNAEIEEIEQHRPPRWLPDLIE
jgi:hypothetical protein